MTSVRQVNVGEQELEFRVTRDPVDAQLVGTAIVAVFTVVFDVEPVVLAVDFVLFHFLFTSKLPIHFSTKLVGTGNDALLPLVDCLAGDPVGEGDLLVSQVVVELGD